MSRTKGKSEAEQAGILVWGKIAAKATEALAPLVILYLMGEADVGAFAALMLVYRTVIAFLTAGFPRAVLYFLTDRPAAIRRAIVSRLTKTNFALGAIAGLLFVVLGVFGPDAVEAIGRFMAEHFGRSPGSEGREGGVVGTLGSLPLLAVFALFDVPARLLPNIFVAERRARASAGVGVIYSLGMACGTLIPAAAGWGVPGIAAGIACFGVAYGVFFFAALGRLYGGTPSPSPSAHIPHVRDLVRYSFPLGITDIVNTLHTSLDLWLITILFPLESVAHYKAGAWQIPIITTIAYSVGAVYLPRFASLHARGEGREAVRLWRESIEKVSLIVVPATLVFIVGAEEFCRLIFPAGYEPAAGVFRAYCFLTLGRVAAFGSVIVAAGKPNYVLKAASLTLLSNAVISIPLVLTMGFLGPAVGTAIAFVPTIFFYCYYIAKASEVPLRFTFPVWGYLRVILAAAPACAAAVAVKLYLPWDYRLVFLVEAVVILVGYALVATVIGLLTREEWRFALDWLRLRVMRDEPAADEERGARE
jgi:O-antigen/teichoic acid export membrane protein